MNRKRIRSKSINIANAATEEELAVTIIDQLKLPELYTHTLRGIEEHLFYDSEMLIPKNLIINGYQILLEKSSDLAVEFLKCLERHVEYGEHFTFKIIDENNDNP